MYSTASSKLETFLFFSAFKSQIEQNKQVFIFHFAQTNLGPFYCIDRCQRGIFGESMETVRIAGDIEKVGSFMWILGGTRIIWMIAQMWHL